MNDTPPPGLGPLLTPDGLTGIAVAVLSSFVVIIQQSVKGWAVIAAALAAAVLTAVVVPIAVNNGYTWGDYLGLIVLMCGALAATIFLIIAIIGRRALERAPKFADGVLDRVENGVVGAKKEDKV